MLNTSISQMWSEHNQNYQHNQKVGNLKKKWPTKSSRFYNDTFIHKSHVPVISINQLNSDVIKNFHLWAYK